MPPKTQNNPEERKSKMDNPTVLVIGGSYAGLHAAELLAEQLPAHWSVTLIERNSHFNHVYSFPRSAVTGDSQRNFIPYTGKLNKLNSSTRQRIRFINASVTKITDRKVFLDRMVELPQSTTQQQPISSAASATFTDSGYASSVNNNNDKKKQLSSSRSIEQIGGDPHSEPVTQRTFQIGWDFLVYALGSHMPAPLTLPIDQQRTKLNGVEFLEKQNKAIEQAEKIVIVGGGALGIQYACDIADRYKHSNHPKNITLIHSRTTFLSQFNTQIDLTVKQTLQDFKVNVILGERVNLSKLKKDIETQTRNGNGKVVVESLSHPNKRWEADLVIPNTKLMTEFCPLAVQGGTQNVEGSTGLIRVTRSLRISPSRLGPSPVETKSGEVSACECGFASLQLSPSPSRSDFNPSSSWKRVFAIGDCVDGFGAIKAGHVGWNQAEVAARNIISSITHLERTNDIAFPPEEKEDFLEESELEKYTPSPPMIKLTLGLNRVITQLRSSTDPNQIIVAEKIIHTDDNRPAWRDLWAKYDLTDEPQVQDELVT
ncbi:hypothetical protein PSTT_12734 [Puccinia striiformis]|uniref:FAD/NAD(P)-binding domain-containing protein n=1 Tax=Puccinia striiformis TaxID=27350 RepID=A0A2S4UV32_9BASI|nr:hypothetical protein PSTT_12734 [Puccinia striiformis]